MSDASGAPRTDGDPPDLPSELTARFVAGLRLFDAGDYHESHEEIEELWSGEVGARRHLLQALIQLAVALHHWERGNFGGALSLCERAREHLAQVAQETCLIEPRALDATVATIAREITAQRAAATVRFDATLAPRFEALRERIAAERARRGLPAA